MVHAEGDRTLLGALTLKGNGTVSNLAAAQPGATGIVAHEAVVRQPPDGYNLVISFTAAMIGNKLLQPKMSHDPLVDLIQQIVYRMGLCDETGKFRVGMAFQQALLNAVIHGNLELSHEQVQDARENLLSGRGRGLLEQRRIESPFSERRVFVDVRLTKSEATLVVRDEGRGFDVAGLQAHAQNGDNLAGGRGLRLMRMFMDEVHFNSAGNEVTMMKRREEPRD